WPAGVVLSGQADRAALASSDTLHFEYLADEVITALDERLQRFLIGTAALGRFSPDLAAAVTGMEDAAELARSLVRRHLFTVRLEAEGEWSRYHPLLRDTLIRRASDEPAALRRQHTLAATWWLGAGEPTEAVRHLLQAGEHARAVEVLEPIAEGMVATE